MIAKIGIVTITYNSETLIRPFLQSVLSQRFANYELYIIDNASADNTVSVCGEFKDRRIFIVANKDNVGVAAGNNQGIVMALERGCTHIHLLNNDVEFEPNLLDKLLYAMDTNLASLVTHKMYYHSDPQRIWYAGSTFTKWERFMAPHVGQKQVDKGQYNTDKYVDYAPTCSVLIRKDVFEDIGYMDEKYFAYYDDTDFFYRICKHKKHRIYYIHDVRFYHKVGGLTRSKEGTATKFKFGNFHIHLSTRNKVYYLKKQKDVLAWINILYFYCRIQLRFLFSGKYYRNFATWKLIQKSFWEGMWM
jgi:GT2 family glycosyltransferase